MNDIDVLTDRLRELGQRAPVPVADPHLDIRRGRVALRRRHARSAVGVTTVFVAAGAVVTSFPIIGGSGGAGDTVLQPAGGPSTMAPSTTASSTPTSAAKDPCTIEAPVPTPTDGISSPDENGAGIAITKGDAPLEPFENDPEVIAARHGYQQAAVTILDPSGAHIDLDSKFNQIHEGSGSWSWTCDPTTGPRLTGAGIKIGWASGKALGMVEIDVTVSDEAEKPVLNEGRWSRYQGQLPDGVTKAQIAEYSYDGGGHAVVVKRTDGLTVAVLTAGVWGNNMPPGSPPATDLPGVDKLLTLAASPRLTLPGR